MTLWPGFFPLSGETLSLRSEEQVSTCCYYTMKSDMKPGQSPVLEDCFTTALSCYLQTSGPTVRFKQCQTVETGLSCPNKTWTPDYKTGMNWTAMNKYDHFDYLNSLFWSSHYENDHMVVHLKTRQKRQWSEPVGTTRTTTFRVTWCTIEGQTGVCLRHSCVLWQKQTSRLDEPWCFWCFWHLGLYELINYEVYEWERWDEVMKHEVIMKNGMNHEDLSIPPMLGSVSRPL